MYDNILIPTDGSEATLEAVTPGIELANQHGATVHALYVVENCMLWNALSPRSLEAAASEARAAGERAVADLVAVAEDHDVPTVSWVLRSPPTLVRGCAHEVVVEYAEVNAVDLIVMGATERSPLSTMVRPSVTHHVMAATDIPVYGRRRTRDAAYGTDSSSRRRPGSEVSD
jgi:nucleotide-binding universal stress UspA family protein